MQICAKMYNFSGGRFQQMYDAWIKGNLHKISDFRFIHQKQAPGLLIPTLDFLRYEFEFERHSAYDQNKRKEIFCQAKAK